MPLTSSLMYLSPIKREQRIKKAKAERRIQMRDELPVLDKYQIRRHRLPLFKALVEELSETEYPSSASFMQQLIDHHERIREEHGPDTPVWCRKRLIESDDILLRLCEAFQKAETANKEGNMALEFDILLELGIKYSLGDEDDWWWLGEQILYQCVNIGMFYRADGGMREALARYIMGKFLLEKMADPFQTTQLEYLRKCRKMSKGLKWSARNVLTIRQDTLFVESSKLTLLALLWEAKVTLKYDPQRALWLCKIAKKRATDSCDRAGEAEVLQLMGRCQMDCNEPKAACESFYRSLVLNLKLNNIEGICENRILLALAYLKVENYPDALYQLETLLAFARENNMPYYMGQAYRYLGEIYINKGQPELATPILAEAVKIFDEQNDAYNRRRAKNLSAISGGQEHMAKYIKLIINCGRTGDEGREYLQVLLDWKDFRKPFWVEGEPDDYKLDYPDILYGQVEKDEGLMDELKALHRPSSMVDGLIGEESIVDEMDTEFPPGVDMGIYERSIYGESYQPDEIMSDFRGSTEHFVSVEEGAEEEEKVDILLQDERVLFEEIEEGKETVVMGDEVEEEEIPVVEGIPMEGVEGEELWGNVFQGTEEYVDSDAEAKSFKTELTEPEEIQVGDEIIIDEQKPGNPEQEIQEVKPETEAVKPEVKPEQAKNEGGDTTDAGFTTDDEF